VTAVTTYDFADRPASLLAQRAGKPDQSIVSSASYLPYGPLNTLTLGNGLTETHAFTQRYFPSSITLGGLLSWTYTTDKVGNVSAIADALNAANNRTYGYQDDQYFLTQGNGPWGTRSWTYDRIGNRLTETHGGVTDTYTYQLVSPPGSGHSPILASIALGAGGTRTYQYDPAGNLQQIAQGTSSTFFTNDDASHLAALATTSPAKGVAFTYDGRDYLTLADTAALPFLDGFETGDVCAWSAALGIPAPPTCPPLPAVHPTYSSEGLLHALQRATAPQRSYVFHFAGRPVAQMDLTGTTESWKLLTVDHLGTPIAATSTSGGLLWRGGFEPFGADWSGAGVFLRFPGQWVDGVWGSTGLGLSYNLHRWYDSLLGRYIEPDPIGLRGGFNVMLYVEGNPLLGTDRLGLKVYRCCAPAQIAAGLVNHCWLKTETREAGLGNLDEGQPAGAAVPGAHCDSPYVAQTQVVNHAGVSRTRPGTSCQEVKDADEECVNKALWTNARGYGPTAGAFSPFNNCQTWVNGVLIHCRKKKCVTPGPPSDDERRYF
jgi:RHS repeat-associated protein